MKTAKNVIDSRNDMYCVYLKSDNNGYVYLSVVVRCLSLTGSVYFARTLNLMNDEIVDNMVNDDLDGLQHAALSGLFTGEFIRAELRLLNDRCPTGLSDHTYGALLFGRDSIEDMFEGA